MRNSLPGLGGSPDSLLAARSNRRLVLTGLALLVVILIALRPSSSAPSSLESDMLQETVEQLQAPGQEHSGEGGPRPKLKEEDKSAPSSHSSIARATLAKDGLTLTQYLDHHFPLPTSAAGEPAHHVWLTLASAAWLRSGSFALHTFAEQLSKERIASGREKQGRETKVVTLCLDEDCVKEAADRGMYAFGGFLWNRPEMILHATWPKLASLIETVRTRDVFFVDADVSFRYDPYPSMEPWMATYDLLAAENESFDHFNSGWMWMRKSQLISDAWEAVLQRDLKKVSRDQNNFNEVLGTAELRRCASPVSELLPASPVSSPVKCNNAEGRFPLKSEFVSLQGIKVHVLDPELFRSHHFEADLPKVSREQSVSFHMTCGDDGPVKEYVAKAQGFWPDTAHHYSKPPPLVTIDHMSGTKEDLIKKMKLLLMAARYTSRAILPPSFATVLSLLPHAKIPSLPSGQHPSIPHRQIYTTFPLPHLSGALGVHIVEPDYVHQALRVLAGGSVLGRGEKRTDEEWKKGSWEERAERMRQLGDVVNIDMRQVRSFTQLHAKLVSPTVADAGVVRLMNLDYQPTDRLREPTNWAQWTWPSVLDHVSTCDRLEDPPGCETICRWPGGGRHEIKVEKGWDDLGAMLQKKEKWEVQSEPRAAARPNTKEMDKAGQKEGKWVPLDAGALQTDDGSAELVDEEDEDDE